MRVRRLARGLDDGYRTHLAQGLKSSAEARRLAEELAFAATRLRRLEETPPGLYAEVASPEHDLEERTWLAFLIAYLGPLDDEDPFASIREHRTSWSGGELPALDGVQTGPRAAHDQTRGTRTLEAYRAWAARAGSQAAAFVGEEAWAPSRRFARAFERLALPGLHRDARFDLLVTLGALGVYELTAGALELGGENEVTVAAKRVFGIGDRMLLARRAVSLSVACEIPLASLDHALYNWEHGGRARGGLEPDAEPDPMTLEQVSRALGL